MNRWHSCTGKVCKVCIASIKVCKNSARTMRKAYLLQTFYRLIADSNRYMTYFTDFLIKSQINNIINSNRLWHWYTILGRCRCRHVEKVCKVGNISIGVCNNHATSLMKAYIISCITYLSYSYSRLFAYFVGSITHFTYFLIKREGNSVTHYSQKGVNHE